LGSGLPRLIARRAIFGSVSELVVIMRQFGHHPLSFEVFDFNAVKPLTRDSN
jgi:hypothetical protein